jgi:hypothetical protein
MVTQTGGEWRSCLALGLGVGTADVRLGDMEETWNREIKDELKYLWSRGLEG